LRRSIAIRALIAGLLALIFGCGEASAALTKRDLNAVGVEPPARASAPLDTQFKTEDARAVTLRDLIAQHPGTALIFADYTCHTLCGPTIAFAAGALQRATLRPGRDYGLIVVGLDPKDSIADARAMKAAQVADPRLAAATTFLTGDAATVQRLTAALGYRYVYDSNADQFAHPAAVFVLKQDGALSRVLSALAFSANDLQLALVEAGNGRAGTFTDRVRLLCYGFDPAAGVYNVSIGRALMLLGAGTVLVLGGAILLMILWPRRPTARQLAAPEAAER